MLERFTHVKVGDQLIQRSRIQEVDCSELEQYRVRVYTTGGGLYVLEDQQALDLVMALRPSAVEGLRFRYARHAWIFHNMVAHPGLQVLSWFGLSKLGFILHDATIPRPKDRKPIATPPSGV